MILSGVVRHWLDFFIILVLLAGQRGRRVLGGAPGGQRHRRAQGQAGDQGPGEARREVDQRRRRASWCRATSSACGWATSCPADARLLDGDPVEVDQSALTGESLPVDAQARARRVFSGSIIRQGEIDAMVYATGANTYFGKTAQLVQEAHTVSHFQRAVLKIGNYLIVLAGALVALIVTVALFRGDPMSHDAAVRAGADGRGDSGGDADGSVGDHGRRARACWPRSRRSSPAWRRSRSWPAWTCSARTRPAR